MQLTVQADQTAFVEGTPDSLLFASAQDIDRVIEACFAHQVSAALLYAANLPASFFDLSSGQAGIVLQKLANYRIRLAVVRDPVATYSRHFNDLMIEEQRGNDFAIFSTREQACAWLASAAT